MISANTLPNVNQPLQAIRVKITDRCHWNCKWCHNEGVGAKNPSLNKDIYITEEFLNIVAKFQEYGFNEIHLTGGEPTNHPDIIKIVSTLTELGMVVKMTSIGCSPNTLRDLASAGLAGLNISLHALDPENLHQTQLNRSYEWVKHQLEKQLQTIYLAKDLGLKIKINTVISNYQDKNRVLPILNWAKENNLPLRLLNNLDNEPVSSNAIQKICDEISATPQYTKKTNGVSSYVIYYQADGFQFGVKLIDTKYLEHSMCNQCMLRDLKTCKEKFYGIRIEKRVYNNIEKIFVRLCLHRTEASTLLPSNTFFSSYQFLEILQNQKMGAGYE